MGPLAGGAVVTSAYANGDENGGAAKRGAEEKESVLGELHGTLANITLGLVILHILGVALASIVHRENLAAAMVSGRKRAED